MSVGTAVVGCAGGVDDLITDERRAVVFDPDDEVDIYGCLRRLLDGREIARKLASEAQDYVREEHSVSKMISSMLEIYRETVTNS